MTQVQERWEECAVRAGGRFGEFSFCSLRAVQSKAEIVQERLQLVQDQQRQRFSSIERAIADVTTVIVTSARLEERIRAVERRVQRVEGCAGD